MKHKRLHLNLAVPFEVYLLNIGCKANFVRHQAVVQYWRKGSKTMEINAFGIMNNPMHQEYQSFLNLYLKLGRTFIEGLRKQVKVA